MASAFLIDYVNLLRNITYTDGDSNYICFVAKGGYRFEVTQMSTDEYTVSHYASASHNAPSQESTISGEYLRTSLSEIPSSKTPSKVGLYHNGTLTKRTDW